MTWQGPAFTPVTLPPVASRIRYGDTIVLVGSCFTEHIGQRLTTLKYDVNQNPFGILYNPVSLANALHRIIHQQFYTANELVYHDGLYHSMDHHGSFSGPDPAAVLENINTTIASAYQDLLRAGFVFISPGTAIVHQYIATGAISGNCHKLPPSAFSKSMLSVPACLHAFEQLQDDINSISPTAKLIWTISPVRHLSDGLVNNQRSKSTLIMALHFLLEQHPADNYFPAYEILIDQLRDYRYYERDMTHPSTEAIDIIWNTFKTMFLDESEFSIHDKIEKLHRAMAHRFLHDQPEARRTFAETHLKMISEVLRSQPHLSFEKESAYFHSLCSANKQP
jgi:hypothetical protein